MKLSLKNIVLVASALAIFSCVKSPNDKMERVVVRVDSRVLTLGNVSQAVPDNLSKEDSTLFANDFIKRWVKTNLLLQRAELNLSPEEKDVDELLDEYRTSLLIYRYQTKLVEQKYSSTISDEEMKSYYNAQIENYKLWEPVIKGLFIKLSKSAPNLALVDSKYRSLRSSDLTDLEGYCFQNARKYSIFADQWVTLTSVTDLLPSQISNIEEILKRDGFYTTADLDFKYYIAIHDAHWVGEYAPFESVKDKIRALLVNKKRLEFIKSMETDIYDDGVRSGNVEFFE